MKKEDTLAIIGYTSLIILIFFMLIFTTHGPAGLVEQEPYKTIFFFQKEMAEGNLVLWSIFITDFIVLFGSAIFLRYLREERGEIGLFCSEGKIQEPTEYKCPTCGGMIQKVTYNFPDHSWHRWTCEDCERDYGYNTDKPTFIQKGV